MADNNKYVKFKQGLEKDFNTTKQPLTDGMVYFVIDANNHGAIYYDTALDGAKETKTGTLKRVRMGGLPTIKVTGSVTGTGKIGDDGASITIDTVTNHSHGLMHQNFIVTLPNDDTVNLWTQLGNVNNGFWLKSVRGQSKAPNWFQPDYSAGIAFGGADTKGVMSLRYQNPSVRFAGGNSTAPVWYFTITGANNGTYDLTKIGGNASSANKLNHNVTFKINPVANQTNGEAGVTSDLSGNALNLTMCARISGFENIQSTRFQGNADSATWAGYSKGLYLSPETRQADMNFNLAASDFIKRVTYQMATSTTTKNKPPVGDANILSFGWDNSGYGSQLAIQNGGSGHLAVRGASSSNGASSWGAWSTVLDSSNYTSYVNNYYWANVKVSTTSNAATNPTFATVTASGWIYSSSAGTGWMNSAYGGGIYMNDKTWVRIYGDKEFYVSNTSTDAIYTSGGVKASKGFTVDQQMSIYPSNGNELNFGGTSNASTIYFGYRAIDSKPIPTTYVFGTGNAGSATIKAAAGWLGNKYFSADNWIGWYNTKGNTSSTRYGYIQNEVEANKNMHFRREQGGNFDFNGHLLPSAANTYDLGSSGASWKNLHIQNISLYGQTANRLMWTNGSKAVQAGYHYADTTHIAVNSTSQPSFNFYVNGSTGITGSLTVGSNAYINRNIILNSPSTEAGDINLSALGMKGNGYPVYTDPEFESGQNSVDVYNNAGNGTVTITRIDDSTSGNSTNKILKITHTGSASPDWGGFYQTINSRANAVFVQIFRAKIPSGYKIKTATNSMGSGYQDTWITSNSGTGKWEWYARRVVCGKDGTFSNGGHVYLSEGTAPTSSAPVSWYLSYCNVYDLSRGAYDGLKTRYSDIATYASDNTSSPIHKRFISTLLVNTSNGTTFSFKGQDGSGGDRPSTITIPNASSEKAGLITNASQTLSGDKTWYGKHVMRIAGSTTTSKSSILRLSGVPSDQNDDTYGASNAGLELWRGGNASWQIVNESGYLKFRTNWTSAKQSTYSVQSLQLNFGTGLAKAPYVSVNGENTSYRLYVNATDSSGNSSSSSAAAYFNGTTTHNGHIYLNQSFSLYRNGRSSNWNQAHSNAMMIMSTAEGWSPFISQKASNGWWTLGHYTSDGYKDEWLFGYLANANVSGTTGASNSLSTIIRFKNLGKDQMIVTASNNSNKGSSATKPIYIDSKGMVEACSYSLSSTVNAGTANRMAYYSGANAISAAGHYVDSNKVAINDSKATTAGSLTFHFSVNGYSYLGGTTYVQKDFNIRGNESTDNTTHLRFLASDNTLRALISFNGNTDNTYNGTTHLNIMSQYGDIRLSPRSGSVNFCKSSIRNLAVGGGIYWDPYVESDSDASDAASITVIKSGVAGGTELRISQQNDATDVINLTANSYIYLNSKKAFIINDSWLRINEGNGFSSGVYFGTSIVRTDNVFQAGDSGNGFYANKDGLTYVKNSLNLGMDKSSVNNTYRLNIQGGKLFYHDDGSLIVYTISNTQNTGYGSETIAIQTCFDNKDPSTSDYVTQYEQRCNLLLQPRGGQVYIGKELTTDGNATYDLWVNGQSYFNNLITSRVGESHLGLKLGNTYLNAIGGELILQNNTSIRFGNDNWDYNQWAGLRYIHSSKSIYLGLADGSIFTANSAQSGGTLLLPGIRYFSINGKTAIDANDSWLRINEGKAFTNGIYFGSNITRTDGEFQVGSSGSAFYAKNNGNGYFSNTLGIGGTQTNYKLYVNGVSWINGDLWSNSHKPNVTNTYSLGNSSYVWKDAYITTVYGNATTANKLNTNAGSSTKPVYFSNGIPVQCNDTLGVNITGNAATATNADKLDNYHASTVYQAATYTINNYSSTNDWIRIATIKIDGTNLAMGGFTAILSNRECLDSSSFILTVAIRRNSTSSIGCQAFYTPIGSSSPRQILIRSNDGINFYVYFKSELNSWTTYYNVTKIMTENNVTFENIGIASSNLIAGSVLNITASRGGYVNQAISADSSKRVYNDSTNMAFHWNGQSGQPTWLWGGNSSGDMYVYNPSNFSVNYANSAGNAKSLYLKTSTRESSLNYNLNSSTYQNKITYSLATSSITDITKKPLQKDAFIITFGWDNSGWGSQLAMTSNGTKVNHIAIRSAISDSNNNNASSWGDWITLLDSSNYTSYVNNYYWANIKVSTSSNTGTSPTFSTVYTSNWYRSTGSTGWYNETHKGGIYMTDDTWVRIYNSKKFYVSNTAIDAIYTSGGVKANTGWFGNKYLSSDNWIGWYTTHGDSSSTRYGYIRTQLAANGQMQFVKEQGGSFSFNSSVYVTDGAIRLNHASNEQQFLFEHASKNNHTAYLYKGSNTSSTIIGVYDGTDGSVWLYNTSGKLALNKTITLSTGNYGSSLPSSGTNGQVFFKI